MTCALAPSSPSSRSQTTSPVTRGDSRLPCPIRQAAPGPCALPSPRLLLLLKVTAQMRINQSGLVPEPPPPPPHHHSPAGGTRSLMWKDTTRTTPVSSPPPHLFCLLLLHLHVFMFFCQRLPGILQPSGFISHLFFAPLSPPPHPSCASESISPIFSRLWTCTLRAAANSSHLSHQTANCCCSTQLPSSSSRSSCSPPLFEKIICFVLLEQMILCACVCVCAALFSCLQGPWSHRAEK